MNRYLDQDAHYKNLHELNSNSRINIILKKKTKNCIAPLNPTKLPRHNLIQRIIPSSIIVITHILILITITIIISTTSLDLILSNKRLAVGVNDQDNPWLYPSLTS